ncbi:hypothetical protein [Arenimonas composti]|uniref:Lipid A biosynthesis lauroyl acyltransferase n=1 Tax=Arenimonas composti TR7-09 = DSM 18010 TaxID=1121013 RepID=A0A091BDU0_9GAMM|nr:hypothetical protein [Arenimonas composti]KFN49901.1 hypothetical protein P873_08640 [Arenimonas composti TR7-09 = DSM 18010]
MSSPSIPLASHLLHAVAWLVGRLPRSLQIRLGAWSGRRAFARNTREAKVARRNLELVMPQLSSDEREALVREVMQQTGRNAIESLRIWTRPRRDNLALVAAVHGEAVLAAAEAGGRGVIIAAPHHGNIEMVVEFMAARGPFTLVYKPPENRAGDGFLRLARGRHNVGLVPAEASAMRPLLRALQAGQAVGITPDQQPKEGGGQFAPFFGRPALTMTLIPKLAQRTGAAVVFACALRRDDGRFEMWFEAAGPAVADADLAVATQALNAGVEAIARRDTRQYQWTYKRWSKRPADSGLPNPYHPDCY